MGESTRKRTSGSVWRAMSSNTNLKIGAVIVVSLALAGIFAPWIAPHDPYKITSGIAFSLPTSGYPLGTDELGRCIFSRMIYGTRITYTVGIAALGIALATGVPIGLVSGYYRSLDNIIMRFIDILMSFPGMLLAIAVVAVLGPGLVNVTLAVGIGTMPAFARLVRGSVLSIRESDYVESARALGAGDIRIIVRHIMINCLPPIIVYSTLQMAWVLLSVSTLSFLGMGAQPPAAEWGALVSTGRTYMRLAPHISTFPCIFIFLSVLGFNLLGDGLRDVMDPRMTGSG